MVLPEILARRAGRRHRFPQLIRPHRYVLLLLDCSFRTRIQEVPVVEKVYDVDAVGKLHTLFLIIKDTCRM